MALADCFTPGISKTAGFRSWNKYIENWASYLAQLTGDSPAHQSKCMAYWWQTRIAGKLVVVAKSELHLSTDAVSLPIKQLWQQMIGEVDPELVITTGTAGGIDPLILGDVNVTNAAKFNCTEKFKAESWAQQRFVGPQFPQVDYAEAVRLMAVTSQQHLATIVRPNGVYGGDVETVDYFAFADSTDSYGVVKNDPNARCEEMDDAVLPLALAGHESSPLWLSIRNASDPQVPKMFSLADEKKWAEKIYVKYGYWTTVNSVIACWAAICTLAAQG